MTHREQERCRPALPRCCLCREGKPRRGGTAQRPPPHGDREKQRWVSEFLAQSPWRATGGHPTTPMPWGSSASIPLIPQVPAAYRGQRGEGGAAQLSAGGPGPQGHQLTLVPKQTPLRPPWVPRWHPKLVCPEGRGLLLPRLPAQPLIPSLHPSRPRSPLPSTGVGPETHFQPLQSTWDAVLLQADPQPPLPPRGASTSNGVNFPTHMLLNKVPFHTQSLFVFAF